MLEIILVTMLVEIASTIFVFIQWHSMVNFQWLKDNINKTIDQNLP